MTKASILLELLEKVEIGDTVSIDMNKFKKCCKSKYLLKSLKDILKKGLIVSGVTANAVIVKGNNNRSAYGDDNFIIQKKFLCNHK